MTPEQKKDAYKRAVSVIKANDRGSYTIPTKGLYPFQWNWDSCFTALGQAHFDPARAWTEIETLFAHQWDDGMVPHIVFHVYDDGYFPGPTVWNTGREIATSGITQPPVAGYAVARLFDLSPDKNSVARRARPLIDKITRWHRWFHSARDPAGEGLVAIIHPWESGRDNSIDWDTAFERVPTEGVEPYRRRDTDHADPEQRPTKAQYDRYLWLVQHFRALGWDNSRLHDASPFRVVDPGFNAILIRSCGEVARLARQLGETAIAEENEALAEKGLAALERLWSAEHGQYLGLDRVTGKLIDSLSIGGLMPVFAPIPLHRAAAIAGRIAEMGEKVRYLVPSHDPAAAGFDARRYWRGPVWLVVNYLIADGLRRAGREAMAEKVIESGLELIFSSGFAEYYDPTDGTACGGGQFTWTAATVLEFIDSK